MIPSDSDKKYIESKLKEEGLEDYEISFDERRNFFIIKDEDKIKAFFGLSYIDFDYTPFMILEYFWIHPSKRKKGRFFKRVAQTVKLELNKLGHNSVIIDARKNIIPLIKKITNKKPYGFSGNSSFFFVELSDLRILK